MNEALMKQLQLNERNSLQRIKELKNLLINTDNLDTNSLIMKELHEEMDYLLLIRSYIKDDMK